MVLHLSGNQFLLNFSEEIDYETIFDIHFGGFDGLA